MKIIPLTDRKKKKRNNTHIKFLKVEKTLGFDVESNEMQNSNRRKTKKVPDER